MFETFGLEHPLSLLVGGCLRFALRILFLIAWVFAFGALVFVLRACFACCFSRRFLHRICLDVLRTLDLYRVFTSGFVWACFARWFLH